MKLLSKLGSAFFPDRCCICSSVIKSGEYACEECKPLFIHAAQGAGVCSTCSLLKSFCACGKRLYYEKSAAPFFYTGAVKRAVFRFKFRGQRNMALPFAGAMQKALEERLIPQSTDLITFVPMSRQAQKKRGYNQAQLLAKELSTLTGIPMKPTLTKYKSTLQQHTLGFFGRRGNMLGAFDLDKEAEDVIKGKNILITDDIITSGSTLNEAAKTLLIFGAESVCCACIAMAVTTKSTAD